MKKAVFCVLIIMTTGIGAFAGRYVRYNQVGFFPKAQKRIIVMSVDECKGVDWVIKDKSGAVVLFGKTGASVCGKNDHMPFAFNYEIDASALSTEGVFIFEMPGIKPCPVTVSANPFAPVVQSNLRWLRASRAGSKEVLDRKPGHFGDSACYVYRRKGAENTDTWDEDAKGKRVNMLGGWYDGYEYLKFTLTAALTTYALLRSYETTPALFAKKHSTTELVDILDEAKWGLDYLLKTMPDDREFIIEVGDFADNERGALLPEEDPLDGKRPAYSIFSPNQMGTTAAALALGSAVFAKLGKKSDAEKYKALAVRIFDKAVSREATAPAWLEKEWALCEDETQYDNLLLAAAELYRLTNEQKYLTHAQTFAKKAKNSWWAAYSSAHMLAHHRSMEKIDESKKFFLEDLNGFFGKATAAGNLWHAPQEYSLFHTYATIEVATGMLLYQTTAADKKYEKSALYMLDYVLGANNWGLSFVSLPYIKNCVKNYYSQIYMLQTDLFPEGGIAVGPVDTKTHDDESKWCYFDRKAQPSNAFNTPKAVFFDHSDDYMCVAANTFGVAEGIFLFSLATALYGDPAIQAPQPKPVASTIKKPADNASTVFLRYNRVGYNPQRQKRMIVMAQKDIKGQEWTISKSAGKGSSSKVASGTLGASVYGKGDHTPLPFNYTVDFSSVREEGAYTFETKNAEKAKLIIKKDPYTWILEKPIRWMRAARCGSAHCVDHGLCHRGDTACQVYYRDGIQNNKWVPAKVQKMVNGSGGWHDAGDYLKFTLTIGYAAYFMLRAYEVNPEIFTKKMSTTDLVDILDEARWGLEFLARCMPDTANFIIQIGDYADHNVGLRLPENDELDGKRPALCALSRPQMGYAAAALAVGSILFDRLGKKEEAKRYRETAERIFARADSKDAGTPAWFSTGPESFYDDDSENDNMELAAAELFRCTNNQKYFAAAKKYSDKARSAGWRAWESVNMPAHLSLMEHYSVVKNDLLVDLDGFLANSKKPGNLWGVPQKYVWGGLYCYIGVASAALEYHVRTQERKYESLALNMLDYTLGCNNWGICFVAAQEIDYTIRNPFSQIYTLQSDKFPVGAISEGPGDRSSWNENKNLFAYDPKAQPTHRFNTDKGVFYDHSKDYMCMETTINGIADGIFMLALASKLYRE